MRRIHRADRNLFVVLGRLTLPLTTGCRAPFLVAAMSASNDTFACATPAKMTEDWLGGTARMLTLYGGVQELITPDNPRTKDVGADKISLRQPRLSSLSKLPITGKELIVAATQGN